MVFTEFAALVQSRWLLLRGRGGGKGNGDGGGGASPTSRKAGKAGKAAARGKKTTRGRSRSRSRSQSRRRRSDRKSASVWVRGSVEDVAMMRESLGSDAKAERFADSVGSFGSTGYSTLDEDEELNELLRRRSSLVDDPVERVCAEAAAVVVGFKPKAVQTPGEAGRPGYKALGSPEVETEPEDEDDVGLLRDSDPFSDYSTLGEDEEGEEEEEEEQERVMKRAKAACRPIEQEQEERVVRLAVGLELSLSDPPLVVEIHERVDIDAVKIDVFNPLVESKKLETGLVTGEDMFGQPTTPSNASSCGSTPSPSRSPSHLPVITSTSYCAGSTDEYASEIYSRLRAREPRYRVPVDFLASQPSVRPKMRAVLVDWLVEVHERFELEPQTLFLTVNYLDRYLSLVPVRAQRLQLVGVAALLIASKFEEIYPCDMDDLLYICERSYSREELVECERGILNALRFELAGPTASSFLDYLVHALEAGEDQLVAHVAAFLAESSLLDAGFSAAYAASEVAAASLLAAYCLAENQSPALVWSFRRQELSGYALEALLPCARELWRAVEAQADGELLAVSSKYSAAELSHAAQMPLGDLERLLA